MEKFESVNNNSEPAPAYLLEIMPSFEGYVPISHKEGDSNYLSAPEEE